MVEEEAVVLRGAFVVYEGELGGEVTVEFKSMVMCVEWIDWAESVIGSHIYIHRLEVVRSETICWGGFIFTTFAKRRNLKKFVRRSRHFQPSLKTKTTIHRTDYCNRVIIYPMSFEQGENGVL